MSAVLHQSDPPGRQWMNLHLIPSSGVSSRRRTLDSLKNSIKSDGMRRGSGTKLNGLNASTSSRRSLRLEVVLSKRNSYTNDTGDCSIPQTVSTSSSCTESDCESSISFTERHNLCNANESDRRNTLAMDAWSEVAHEYHKRVEPFTSQFLPFLLNRNFLAEHGEDQGHDLHYLRGKSVLDVATGTGAAALYAISKGAKVTATDFSEEMLKIAETRARRRTHSRNVVDLVEKSLVNFKPRLADGENLPSVWTDQFDITCSNFGVIYFSNVNRGIEEMVRCTKPGGKVCLSAWGQKEMTNAFRIFPAAIRICGFESKWNGGFSEKPNFFLPLRRISADKHLLYRHLYSAGLSDVKVIGPFPRELRLSSAEEYWYRFVLACPNVKRVVEHFFTKDERQMLKETVIQLVKEEAREAEIFNDTETLDPLGSQCHGVSLSSLSTSKIENAAKSKVAIADSGATHHLWPDYSAFVSYKKVSDKFVSLADQSSAPIHGIGDIAVSLGGKKALIRNAYHVPSLKAPLYSLGAHRRLPGCSFVGNNDTFEITFPNFSLSVHDDVDSYLEYRPLGKNISKISFDYIEPRPKSSTSITRKNDCIVLSAAAYIAFGTKEEPPKQIKM